MTRLVRIELSDFQPWERLCVDFDPFVTVIVGANGVGKSSLIRALRWVVFNRPLGDSVIRWGADGARVKLLTEDCKVVREKRHGVNCYRLNGSRYDALGTSVPERVAKSLRLSEVNFQQQIAPPFWLAQSASEVAREMNRVVDLEVIDRSLSCSAGKIKTTGTEIKLLEEMAVEAEARVKALDWVPKAERLLAEATRIAQDVDAATQRLEGMVSLVEVIKAAQTTLQAILDVSPIEELNIDIANVEHRRDGLTDLVSSINAERDEWSRLSMSIEALEDEAEKLKPSVCPACGQEIQTDPS